MGMFTPQIGLRPLEGLCRRVGTSLEAGVDARTVWKREAERATGVFQSRLFDISDAVSNGYSLADALKPTGDYFPPIFIEMIKVGESTGHLDTIFRGLADHYETRLKMRRMFLMTIAWPMLELVLSLGVIGLAIWITGVLGLKVDILGLGLMGNSGLFIYVVILATIAGAIFLIVRAISRGMVWTKPIQRFVLALPGIGKPLQTLALARLAWSMNLTMGAGMEVRRALRLSLQSTQNARYTDQIPTIDAEIMAGNSLYETFHTAGGYPVEFLDTLAVGEQSGKVVESMGRLAIQYQDRARIAMAAIAVIAGVGVLMLVAGFIIIMIFKIFMTSYLGPINEALKMRA
jgi:type II secretory pathway component PulF